MKTPARLVQPLVLPLCNLSQTKRELVTPKIYVLHDAAQVEIGRFDDSG